MFVVNELGLVAGPVASNSLLSNVWIFNAPIGDDVATITASGYFADAGSDTGTEMLKVGDLIWVPNRDALLSVSDAAAGTATALISSAILGGQPNIPVLGDALTGRGGAYVEVEADAVDQRVLDVSDKTDAIIGALEVAGILTP